MQTSLPESIGFVEPEFREIELTDAERYLCDLFASNFVLDQNIKTAALKIGFNEHAARRVGEELYNKGYTQRRISHLLGAPVTAEEYDYHVNKAFRVLSQTLGDFDPRARIVAAKELHRIHQTQTMIPDDSLGNDGSRGGVMVIPVTTDSLDDWGKAARESQRKLKASLRDN